VKTVILDVRAPAEAMADFVRAGKTGKPEHAARISFATPELLWEVLSAKRWEAAEGIMRCGPGIDPRGCASRRP
jgi:hypothetical protein